MPDNKILNILPITDRLRETIDVFLQRKGLTSIGYKKGRVTFYYAYDFDSIRVPIDPYLKDLLSVYMYIEEVESIVLHGFELTITISSN